MFPNKNQRGYSVVVTAPCLLGWGTLGVCAGSDLARKAARSRNHSSRVLSARPPQVLTTQSSAVPFPALRRLPRHPRSKLITLGESTALLWVVFSKPTPPQGFPTTQAPTIPPMTNAIVMSLM